MCRKTKDDVREERLQDQVCDDGIMRHRNQLLCAASDITMFIKNHRKTQPPGVVRRLVTEYCISDMMKYYCVRVSKRDATRIGPHSPSFSEFQSEMRGSFDPEMCRVPIPSIFGELLHFEN